MAFAYEQQGDLLGLRIAVSLAGLWCACACAQDVILKAGTQIVVENTARIVPAQAKVGDAVEFATVAPLRQAERVVLPRKTALHGHITAVKPTLVIALDSLPLAGAQVMFQGSPFAVKPPKHEGSSPAELDHHYTFSTKEKAELGAAGIVVVPLVVGVMAVASPFIAYSAIKHHGEIGSGRKGVVTIAADTPLDAALLPPPDVYTGLPILYVVDRFRTPDNEIFCGTDSLSAKGFNHDLPLRLPTGEYTFHTSVASQPAVTVHAQQNGRYLLYRDKAGLQAIDLATRPDLRETLPAPDRLKFFYDYGSLDEAHAAAFDEARQRGGCPTMHQLQTRPPRDPQALPASAP